MDSGFYDCMNEIEMARLPAPIVYEPFTVYFDSKALEQVRDKYGESFYRECMESIDYGAKKYFPG